MRYSYWAKPRITRIQEYLAAPTLDDLIPEDDEIRLFDALLEELDWSLWEEKYQRQQGKPPLHPRLVAGTIIFGMTRRLQSSRDLEEATRRRIDLIWFLEGRTIDHSTICNFRITFADLLPGLFDDLARKAAEGPRAGRALAADGTRIRANSDRHGARTASSLRRRLAEVAESREELFSQMARLDVMEDLDQGLETPSDDTDRAVRTQIEALDSKRERLLHALERAEERDALKQRKDGPKATPTRVPVSDPDAYLLPNKEGGYAPNYTPTIAVDVESGAIVDAQVPDGADEAGTLAETIEESERRLGNKPETLLCDAGFVSGSVLKNLERQQVAICSPSQEPVAPAAKRDDPNQPITPVRLGDLPTTGSRTNKRFAREAFVYDNNADCYYCPQGRVLRRVTEDRRHDKNGRERVRWRYQRSDCSDCPLRARCLKGKAQRRSIVRDQYQPYCDRLATRMQEPANQELYKKRAPAVEGAFGIIKNGLGFRRFLRRGRAAVQNEWQWVCVAFNAAKILRRRLTQGPPAPRGGLDGAERRICCRQLAFLLPSDAGCTLDPLRSWNFSANSGPSHSLAAA